MNAPSTSTQVDAHRVSAPGVLDEAFAELPELARRIDDAAALSAPRDYAAESRQMIAQIGEQLKSIEKQRARLVKLLAELDVSSS